MRVAQACLENISPDQLWSIADLYPDLVKHLHGINGGVPWLTNTDSELCLLCKESVEDVSHFLLDCPNFRDNRESLWSNLSQKVIACNPSDGTQVSHFFSSLVREQKTLLLFGEGGGGGGSLSPFSPGYSHYGKEVHFLCGW